MRPRIHRVEVEHPRYRERGNKTDYHDNDESYEKVEGTRKRTLLSFCWDNPQC